MKTITNITYLAFALFAFACFAALQTGRADTCPVSFSPATNFVVGPGTQYDNQPYSVAVGDFNGDGKKDLAVANFFQFSVSILLGDGTGNFGAATIVPAGDYPTSVAVGDFNGDGRQDLAVTDSYANAVSILLGNGDGTFSARTSFGAGSYPLSVAVGDFNGDGKQDLAVANGSSNDVSILLGNGDGSFQPAVNFGAGSAPQSVAVGDFNGDGKQDLAVPNAGSYPDYNDGAVSILLGNGDGTFSPATSLALGSFTFSVAVGDFNGDGKQDLAVSNNRSDNVSILLGDGTGNFSAPTNFGTGAGPLSVAVGDFNADGKQDLAVTNSASVSYATDKVSILLGNGDGSFQPAVNFDVGSFPLSAAVGDFNGDGKQDLAVANRDSNNVSILLNESTPCSSPCQFATSVASNFNGTPIHSGDYIWFNGVLKPSGLGSNLVTIRFTQQTITSANFTLSVPDTSVTFDPAATSATTTFSGGMWVTRVPSSGLAGNTFLSALGYLVPANLPGGIRNVTWNGTISSDTPGVSVQWKWAAAVYTNFSADYNALGVKPVDDNRASQYQNSDHAGTPENFKSHVIGGAKGGGGSNYTGGYSGTASVGPCQP